MTKHEVLQQLNLRVGEIGEINEQVLGNLLITISQHVQGLLEEQVSFHENLKIMESFSCLLILNILNSNFSIKENVPISVNRKIGINRLKKDLFYTDCCFKESLSAILQQESNENLNLGQEKLSHEKASKIVDSVCNKLPSAKLTVDFQKMEAKMSKADVS